MFYVAIVMADRLTIGTASEHGTYDEAVQAGFDLAKSQYDDGKGGTMKAFKARQVRAELKNDGVFMDPNGEWAVNIFQMG